LTPHIPPPHRGALNLAAPRQGNFDAAVRGEQMDKIESKRSPSTVVISLDVSRSFILIYSKYTFITEEFAEILDEFRPVNGVAVQSHYTNNGDHSSLAFKAPEKLGINR
jgi:hypothetical protein